MMSQKKELPSGVVVRTYDDQQPEKFKLSLGNSEHIEKITKHIEKFIGPIKSVFHEIVSDKVHIDVHWVEPSETRPYNVLITSGMSDKPMNVPEELEYFRLAELCMLLPPDWPLNKEAIKDINNFWPIHQLKQLARFPHDYNTFLFLGHTIGGEMNGTQTLSPNCPFCGFLFYVSPNLGSEIRTLTLENGEEINFYCLIPLYKEEIDFKMNRGLDELLEKLVSGEVSDIVDMTRSSVV